MRVGKKINSILTKCKRIALLGLTFSGVPNGAPAGQQGKKIPSGGPAGFP
jgi:hypothetical protein